MNEYIKFDVTGITSGGKRFSLRYSSSAFAFGINLWRGTVWGVLPSGKRKLLKRVYN